MKKILGIFVVFLIFFYAETGISATILLCGEVYKLDVPLIAKKTVSFTDKFGDDVQIYSLTSEIVNTFDNRTFTDIPQEKLNLEDAHLVYVKNNKVFGLSEKNVFYFLDHNADKCNVAFDLKKYEKIYPLSKEYNYDYSNLYGAMVADFGYIGDNESVGHVGEAQEQEYYTSAEEKNSALTPELTSLIEKAKKLDKGYTVPQYKEYNSDYSILYYNYAFYSLMDKALTKTLHKGINHVYIANYEEEMANDDEYSEEEYESSEEDYENTQLSMYDAFSVFEYTTPLMMAVYAGYNDIATYLLDHGANPAYYNNGADALLFAIVTKNKDMIYKLVESGAPVIRSRIYNNKVISYARNGNDDLVEANLEDLMNEFLDKETINYLKQNAYKE